MKAIGRFLRTILILAIILIGGAIAYAFSGHYDVSVGTGHTAVTQWYLDTVRKRSIAHRAEDITVPDLDDDEMIKAGAEAYDNSCAGCHGRPGREPNRNFDPRPPALTRGQPDPAKTFWVTRNGIKMSGMPSRTEEQLSDEGIWSIVAFLQVASRLTEGEYRQVAEPPAEQTPPEEVVEEEEIQAIEEEEEAYDEPDENADEDDREDGDTE